MATACWQSNKSRWVRRASFTFRRRKASSTVLAADTGKVRWAIDVGANQASAKPELFSTPFIEEPRDDTEKRRIYFGMTLTANGRAGALVCYEEVTKKE